MQFIQGVPLAVTNEVTAFISRVITSVAHLFSAIYKGPMSLHL